MTNATNTTETIGAGPRQPSTGTPAEHNCDRFTPCCGACLVAAARRMFAAQGYAYVPPDWDDEHGFALIDLLRSAVPRRLCRVGPAVALRATSDHPDGVYSGTYYPVVLVRSARALLRRAGVRSHVLRPAAEIARWPSVVDALAATAEAYEEGRYTEEDVEADEALAAVAAAIPRDV